MSTLHLKVSRTVMIRFLERENMAACKKGIFKLWELRDSPTTLTLYYDGELRVSVSDTGECRFYEGARVPGLENIALMEGQFSPQKMADFPRTKIGYHDVERGVPQWDTAPFVQFESVPVTESRKVPVEAIRKYGQMKSVTDVKYDKPAKPTILGTGRKLRIRIKSAGKNSWKAELQKNGMGAEVVESTSFLIIPSLNGNKPKTVIKKRRCLSGGLGNRVTMVKKVPCRVSLGGAIDKDAERAALGV